MLAPAGRRRHYLRGHWRATGTRPSRRDASRPREQARRFAAWRPSRYDLRASTPAGTPISDPISVARSPLLVISCEHGGNEVPGPYAPLFAGLEAQLESHRGWDPGALQLARQLAAALNAPLHAATTSRLLVDLNRSIGHPHLFSEATRPLPRAERNAIVDRYYRPHREQVEGEIARRIASGNRVIHVASHSFTPTLHGEERRADVAWLYDPRRAGERAFARDWMTAFARLRPDLRVRRNYPYRGRDDGLTALLRRRHADESYVGIELEVNQRFVERGGAPWEELRAQLVESLATVMVDAGYHSSAGSSWNTLRVPFSHC